MNEKNFNLQNEKFPEVEGVYFPDYVIKKDSSILVPKPASRVEILRKESDIEKDKSFQVEKVAVATKLVERCASGEVFPFPGLRPERYEIMKQNWEEEPEYAPNIDELIVRFQQEGMKVVFSKNPTSGNVFLLPSGSDDIVNDSLLPRLLLAQDILDDTLLELVMMENLHYLQKQ